MITDDLTIIGITIAKLLVILKVLLGKSCVRCRICYPVDGFRFFFFNKSLT